MTEFVLNPDQTPKSPDFYRQLRPEIKTELVRRAIGESHAQALLNVHPLTEIEVNHPEILSWAKEAVANAYSKWEDYANLTIINEKGVPFTYDGDVFEESDTFIAENQERLIALYEQAEESGVSIEDMTLILSPIKMIHLALLSEVIGPDYYSDSDNIASLGELRAIHIGKSDSINLSVHKQIAQGGELYTDFSGYSGKSDASSYVIERVCGITGKDRSDAEDRPVDMFLIENSAQSDAGTTIRETIVASKDTHEGFGILEWIAATVQEPDLMSSEGQIALPANILSFNGTELILAASYDTDEKQFMINLMPTASKLLGTRRFVRA